MSRKAEQVRPRHRSGAEREPGRGDESRELLLREGVKIVGALGRMLAPICEVVLHDLGNPDSAILAIENPLSGRSVGQATTEMGLARVRDPAFPDVVQNYQNRLPDGRRVKSTSIGLRDADGTCIAAICLNMDLSLFDSYQTVMTQFGSVSDVDLPVRESFRSRSHDTVHQMVGDYAASLNTHPKALTVQDRRRLIQQVAAAGLLQLRGAATLLADILGVTRSTIYNAIRMVEDVPAGSPGTGSG